ncbi:DUF7146 domain-containing protein [Methylobacterium gnaphalii]|uniref:Zinc finger CHC2-type domain-containing protein n=1 Tax=Methylobacterium gnaphalii TaxID=1010610 RepID=A0A512JPC4_9HYPH|nr:primase-helicase zinc-binding domain-containing protein [Methylobacterium gnaphalii]GEP11798.1 hypothetical protein MGN01_36430 [Methylobacterium gnaphalii]GJD69475.1 hypothetical protein MMMDOFMJ_2406 [Methylobacterium gnaphalii]GLS49567.1 hypothetical protein GCM10007885_24160 [Methylobacterium gnaphalii]
MARDVDSAFRQWSDAARAVSIADVCDERGFRLFGRGAKRKGPCPHCDGYDRFDINADKGVWFCRQCHPKAGDVIDLVMWLDDCDFLAAVEILTGQAPPKGQGHRLSDAELAAREQERADRRRAQDLEAEKYRERERRLVFRWWEKALSPRGTIVERYLSHRGLSLPRGARLRLEPAAQLFADNKSGAAVVHTGPAMFAAVTGRDGLFSALHMTWIDLADEDGKARVPDPETGEFLPAKKVRGSQRGGRIELVRHPSPRRLYMGEGIETTLSVYDDLREAGRDISDAAFWAGINLGNIGGPHDGTVAHPVKKDRGNRPVRVPGPVPKGDGIPIPDSVDEVILLGDGDSDPFLTEQTFARAAARWARPGRVIRTAMAPEGTDFNTLRRARLRAREFA